MFQKVGIIGLGYVGLPLAIEFSKVREVVGYDINASRIELLQKGQDNNFELSKKDLLNSKIKFTADFNELRDVDFFIVTVPTPLKEGSKDPDLTPLEKATRDIAGILKKGDIVVYESTVAPGTTRNFCGKLLEDISGLKLNVDFKLGFSPERINPGDKNHSLCNVVKVISGSDLEALDLIANMYQRILGDNIYKASSLEVGEASKMLENVQRDVNIALVNEMSMIFDSLGIPTQEVLEAARTKWNFHNYFPGLVGGHCIGVDPYYLLDLANKKNVDLKVIRSARETNENVINRVIDKINCIKKDASIGGPLTVNIFGITFKANCPDLRNSKSYELYEKLLDIEYDVKWHDPYYRKVSDYTPLADISIISVAHDQYADISDEEIKKVCREGGTIIDFTGIIDRVRVEQLGRKFWAL